MRIEPRDSEGRIMTTTPHRVVIVGAGFGGLEAAHPLAPPPRPSTPVDPPHPHFFPPPPRRQPGGDPAVRPPQPSFVPAAALSGRHRLARHQRDRLAGPAPDARPA